MVRDAHSPADPPPPIGGFREVGGVNLLVHRAGSGGPSVVVLPGAGTVGLDYFNLQSQAAGFTTSFVYDRAGTGWSERIAMPRTAAQVTDELRRLLHEADLPAPYLLVGHSLGGLYARHFAQRFPDEVAGLVLLDPAHEDYAAHMPEALNNFRGTGEKRSVLTAAKALPGRLGTRIMDAAVRSPAALALLRRLPIIRRYQALYRRLFAEEMAGWPAEIRDSLVERHVSLPWLWTGMQEAQNVEQLYDEVRRAGPLADMPLIVVCSMAIDAFRRAVSPGETEAQFSAELEGKRRLYEQLAASVPCGEVRPVDAGHLNIHYRHPEVVVQAIRDVIARAGANALRR